jgi:hypothetical protein
MGANYERWEMDQRVKDTVASANKGWLIILIVTGFLVVAWTLNLRTCRDVDWRDYFVNPSDAQALGANDTCRTYQALG